MPRTQNSGQALEDWHRVLKSGCRIEALQHKTAERLKRAIAINLVIAWRIMLMTLLGRECPDLPAEVLFSDAEIEVLQAYEKKRIAKPIRLGDAVRLVARLGGYIGAMLDVSKTDIASPNTSTCSKPSAAPSDRLLQRRCVGDVDVFDRLCGSACECTFGVLAVLTPSLVEIQTRRGRPLA